MPPPEPTLVRLTQSFQGQLERIYTRAGSLTAARWDALGAWNELDVDRFRLATEPVLQAAKTATINASAGYYSLVTDSPPVTVNPATVVRINFLPMSTPSSFADRST